MKIDKAIKILLNPLPNFRKICNEKNCCARIKQLAIGIFKLLAQVLIAPPLIGGAILLGCYIKKNCCKKTESSKTIILRETVQKNKIVIEENKEPQPILPIKKNGYGGDSEDDRLDNHEKSIRLFTKFKNIPGSTSSEDKIHIKLTSVKSESRLKITYYEIQVKNNPKTCNIRYNEREDVALATFFIENQASEWVALAVDKGHYYNVDRFISKALTICGISISPEEINLNDK